MVEEQALTTYQLTIVSQPFVYNFSGPSYAKGKHNLSLSQNQATILLFLA
jgi:hypothetical protein